MGTGDLTLGRTLLLTYQEGYTVSQLCTLSGLSESNVITKLCEASRFLARERFTVVDPERALGVQWEFVFLGA